MFGYGVDAKVPSRKWSKLRVEFSGKLFTVFFNGQKLFEIEDETFTDAGGDGVWTKADSVTLFDDFIFGGKQRTLKPRKLSQLRCRIRIRVNAALRANTRAEASRR